MPAIRVSGLRKSYGAFEAVRGLDFEVAEGEVFGLLGPNGAGKTTTTEILEGYRSRTAGDVEVLGYDPARAERRFRARIGIVLQECGIQDHLTVEEILRLYGAYYQKRRPVDELIALVELDAKKSAKISSLSGGQRRRVDLALALSGDPDLIFLDEPTTGFDPNARRNAWSVIRNLCTQGKTVLLTTHFMDEAQALADRVAIVAAGRVVAEGTPSSLGGPEVALAEIRFTLPVGTSVSDLPSLQNVDVEASGTDIVVRTKVATQTMHRLTGWAVGRGVELDGLRLAQPSLEDVYLELTARAAAEVTS